LTGVLGKRRIGVVEDACIVGLVTVCIALGGVCLGTWRTGIAVWSVTEFLKLDGWYDTGGISLLYAYLTLSTMAG